MTCRLAAQSPGRRGGLRTGLAGQVTGEAHGLDEGTVLGERDKGGRKVALRPEGTAPVVRAFVQHRPTTVPWKVWYSAPMFRYERPQAGRYRQHQQVGLEALGSDDADLDVEVIALQASFYEALGLRRGLLIINTLGDLRDLFRIYGVGFAILAGLFVALYRRPLRHAERFGVAAEHKESLRISAEIWSISAVAGLVSASLTFGPMAQAPWLPGFAYWLIPIAIGLRGPARRLLRGKRGVDEKNFA